MNDLLFYVLFISISVISRQEEGDNEMLFTVARTRLEFRAAILAGIGQDPVAKSSIVKPVQKRAAWFWCNNCR